MTLLSSYNEFIITQQLKGNSDETVAYYKNCITPMINFFGDNFELSALNASELRKYALYW